MAAAGAAAAAGGGQAAGSDSQRQQQATVDTWRGESYRVRDVERPWRTDVLLPLDELGAKVVACFEGRGAANATARRAANAPGHGAANAPGPAVVFIAYGNMSGTV